MIIAHNMASANTNRQLGINNKSKNTWLERLSSGYRINRAADDSAGLAISEKMRGQIRGLDRASFNIEEGINMINTAEGAMNEQISILQRIRELTVQSYNDTNTQDDRLAIQMEVDALLDEIDRIAEDTEFNTIKVLQGPKTTITTETIQPATEYSLVNYYVDMQGTFPSWATHDAKLVKGNTSVNGANLQQSTSTEYVVFNKNSTDPLNPPKAYGTASMAKTGDNYIGDWTSSLADNYSAKVDFSEIATLTTKEDLLSHIGDLIGTGIGYECYTCEKIQGVCFESGEIQIEEIYNEDRDSRSFARVNLQNYIDKVGSLLEQSEFDALTTTEQSALGGNYGAYVNNTAKEIASGIVDAIVDKTKFDTHFIRTKEDVTNPYQVIFYDFRDDGIAATSTLEGDVLIDVVARVKTKVQVKNQPITLIRVEESGYWIQAGANSEQGIVIDFPDTSVKGIDLEEYTVFPDGYCSLAPDKKYDPSLLIGAKKIGENLYRNENVGGTEVTQTISGTRTVQTSTVKLGTDANGEPKAYIEVGPSKVVSYSYTITTMVGGTAQEFYVYKPDTLVRVDEAISNISKSRSKLGGVTNRLEHAYLNDTNSSENLQAAESKIRDVDMAVAMVAFARDNILEQAGISMLTQANNITEGVVRLLE